MHICDYRLIATLELNEKYNSFVPKIESTDLTRCVNQN